MAAGAYYHWGNAATIVLSVVLAFAFGYALTLWPLLRAGLPASMALSLALAADTLSILVMEIIDNAVMLVVPGAMDAHLTTALFWGSLLASLLLAGIAAYPVNRWLIMRGKGHARVQEHHENDSARAGETGEQRPAKSPYQH